jgi:hypothetical protein
MIVHGFVKEKERNEVAREIWKWWRLFGFNLGESRDGIFVFWLEQPIFPLSFQISDFIIFKCETREKERCVGL